MFLAPIVAMTCDRLATATTPERAEQIRASLLTLCADGIEAGHVSAAALLRVRSQRRGHRVSATAALRATERRSGDWYPAQRSASGRLIAAAVPRPLARLP